MTKALITFSNKWFIIFCFSTILISLFPSAQCQTLRDTSKNLNFDSFHSKKVTVDTRDSTFQGAYLDSNSYFDSKCNSLHSVSIIEFHINCTQGLVRIEWKTRFESNNNLFKIEKSSDMRNWKMVGSIAGAINSDSLRQYNFNEINSYSGNSYYRLLSCDFNDNCIEYEPHAIDCNNAFSHMNVFISNSTLCIDSLIEPTMVNIIDLQGKPVLNCLMNAGFCRVGLDGIAKGVYLIVISNRWMMYKKLVMIE